MKTYVNLFPIAYRRKQMLWLRFKQWTVISCLALGGLAISCGIEMASNSRNRLRLDALRSEYSQVKETADKIEVLKRNIDDLKQRESIVLSLVDEQPVLTLVGLISQATSKCDGGLCVQRMQLERREVAEGRANLKVLLLEGLAADHHLVARFAAALRETEAFQRVELRSSTRRILQETEGQAYSVECVY